MSDCQNGLNQLHTAKLTDMQQQFYSVECLMEIYQQLLSSPMSEVYQKKFFQASTSSMVDSHAKTSVLQDMEKVWQESEAVYFLRSFAWPKKSSPRFYSLKMSQQLQVADLTQLSGKLPKQGMTLDGQLYPLKKLERLTSVKDGGYWATPNTMDHLPLRSEEALKRQFSTTRKGRTKPANLREQVHPECWPQKLFPTPRAMDNDQGRKAEGMLNGLSSWKAQNRGLTLSTYARLFPTPDASPRGPSKTYNPKAKSQSGRTLQSFVAMYPTPTCCGNNNRKGASKNSGNGLATAVGGSLNPTWVEWLMGYSIGWTELSAWVMPWFRCKQGKRLKN